MLRPTILSAALLLHCVLSAQDSATNNPAAAIINFETASCAIDVAAQEQLDAICDRIAREGPLRVSITGHTDRRGSKEYNIALSGRRSEAVRAALAKCAPGVVLELAWQGEENPLLPADETDDVVQNRRVEVSWEVAGSTVTNNRTAKSGSRFDALIPGAAVQFQTRTVEASAPVAWTTADGVTVRINAGAIVDAEGNAVTGPVDLAFRAFTDPWQTIASGIPMHIRTANGIEHMESALMVELIATQNGRPLQLKEGERIIYDLPEKMEVARDFSTFTVDETTGEWQERGALDGVQAAVPDSVQVMSLAVQRYVDRYNYRWRNRDRDTTRFDERAKANNYCGTHACEPAVAPYRRHRGRVLSPYDNTIPAITVELLPGNLTYHLHTGFRIIFKGGSRDFPEWKAFPKGMRWAYDGSLPKKELSKKFVRRRFYQDARFVYDAAAGTALIRLKDRGEWIDLPVDAELADASLTSSGGLLACVDAYTVALNEKRMRLDNKMAQRAKEIKDEDQRHRAYAFNSAKPVMTATEMEIPDTGFHAHAISEHDRLTVQIFGPMIGNDAVARTLTSDGFGLCNIDRIISYDRAQDMIARFQNGTEAPFRWTSAYAICNGRNAVVTLWGNGQEAQKLSVAEGRMDWLVLSTAGGELALVDGQELRGTDEVVTVGYRPLKAGFSMDDLKATAQR